MRTQIIQKRYKNLPRVKHRCKNSRMYLERIYDPLNVINYSGEILFDI